MSIYHVFISHAWHYGDQYNRVVDWLEESTLLFRNYSVPKHDPVDANNTAKLKSALTEQISHANIVIIIAGMYAAHSYWIDYEIDEAQRMGKTIIALKPQGNERVPLKVQNSAKELVSWNSQSLINAIKKY